MTKVTIISESQPVKQDQKIVFSFYLDTNKLIKEAECSPSEYNFIELICRNYSTSTFYFDLMFAYNEDRNNGTLYLGKFNDGVV